MLIGEIEEIYEALIHNGEVEFDYKDKSYIMQIILENERRIYFVIWTTHMEDNNICLLENDISADGCVTKEAIDKALNTKCFDGKSFFEIEPEAELTFIVGL